MKTNSTRCNPLLGSEGQTQPVSTQNSGQLVGLNPKNDSGFQPLFIRTTFSNILHWMCNINLQVKVPHEEKQKKSIPDHRIPAMED